MQKYRACEGMQTHTKKHLKKNYYQECTNSLNNKQKQFTKIHRIT